MNGALTRSLRGAALAAGRGGAGAAAAAGPAATAKAIFAGGCFWCVEADFDKVPGVLSTTSGYIGGKVANPTYEQVSAKSTGHAEAVEIVFDPAKVSYEQLLEHFWRTIDPTTKDRQFCDAGTPYRTAIFARRRGAAEGGAGLAGGAGEEQALQGADRHRRSRWPARSTRPRTTTRTTTRRTRCATSTTAPAADATRG